MRRTAGWGQPPDHGLTTAVNGLSGSGAGAAVRRQCGTTVWQGVPAVGWSVGPVTAGVGLVIGCLAHAREPRGRASCRGLRQLDGHARRGRLRNFRDQTF